jgi:PEGA domain-containing protein
VALETFLSRYVAALLEAPTLAEVAAATPQPPPTAKAATPPKTAPAAQAPQARTQAPQPAAPAAPGAKDLTDLISAKELEGLSSPMPKPLFNPDAPFSVHSQPFEPETKRKAPGGSFVRMAALTIGLLALIGGGAFGYRYFGGTTGSEVAATTGTLIVQSNPAGVQVFVDGIDRGMTPARLSVEAGAHILELRGRGVPRVIPIQVTAGAQVSQYLEFADTPTTGRLQVQSEPAGAKITVDGTPRGVAPLTLGDLTPGDHEVILQNDLGSARHVVTIQAGATASLVAPVGAAAASGPVSGWLAVRAPFSVEIREQGRLLGTTDTDRIMMAAGRHDIELVNDALGYRATRSVQVPPGKVAPVSLDLPNGVVNLNAMPWAEVWIDGHRVGETPIGNLGVTIGPHEVVFKHPQFGEKRHAISVTLSAPVRLSVDMK